MTQSLAFKMAIRPFGDSALLVDIDAGSSDASSDIVMALDSQILRQRTRGITQTTPSSVSYTHLTLPTKQPV